MPRDGRPVLAEVLPALAKPAGEFIQRRRHHHRQVEQRPKLAPDGAVEQQVVPLDQHQPVLGADAAGAGDGLLAGAVEDGVEDLGFIAKAADQRQEPRRVEAFRAALAVQDPTLGQDRVVEVVAVHRQHRRPRQDGGGFRREGGLARAGRSRQRDEAAARRHGRDSRRERAGDGLRPKAHAARTSSGTLAPVM